MPFANRLQGFTFKDFPCDLDVSGCRCSIATFQGCSPRHYDYPRDSLARRLPPRKSGPHLADGLEMLAVAIASVKDDEEPPATVQ